MSCQYRHSIFIIYPGDYFSIVLGRAAKLPSENGGYSGHQAQTTFILAATHQTVTTQSGVLSLLC